MTGKNRIMIYGPKDGGTYVVGAELRLESKNDHRAHPPRRRPLHGHHHGRSQTRRARRDLVVARRDVPDGRKARKWAEDQNFILED